MELPPQEYVLECDLDEIIFASKIIVVGIRLLPHNDLILQDIVFHIDVETDLRFDQNEGKLYFVNPEVKKFAVDGIKEKDFIKVIFAVNMDLNDLLKHLFWVKSLLLRVSIKIIESVDQNQHEVGVASAVC